MQNLLTLYKNELINRNYSPLAIKRYYNELEKFIKTVDNPFYYNEQQILDYLNKLENQAGKRFANIAINHFITLYKKKFNSY